MNYLQYTIMEIGVILCYIYFTVLFAPQYALAVSFMLSIAFIVIKAVNYRELKKMEDPKHE